MKDKIIMEDENIRVSVPEEEKPEPERDYAKQAAGYGKTEKTYEPARDFHDETKSRDTGGKRKLCLVDKIFLFLLIMLPFIMLCSTFLFSAKTFFIVSAVIMLLTVGLSYLCSQWSMLIMEAVYTSLLACILWHGYMAYGMHAEDLSNMSVLKILNVNANMPEKMEFNNYTDEEIVEKLSGKFIYYYRYGCQDCVATDHYIQSIVENNGYEIIPVETRSKFGLRLKEKYPVEEVPSGLVIYKDGSHMLRILYSKDENDNPVPDEKSMQDLMKALEGIKNE